MHLLTLRKTVSNGLCDLSADTYVCEDALAFQVALAAGRGNAILSETESHKQLHDDPNNILLTRIGAYGDLLMLTPSVKEIKRRWPKCRVTVACLSKFKPILFGDLVDDVIDYPTRIEERLKYDTVIDLENVIEGGDPTVHGIDAFRIACGLDDLKDRTLSYAVTQEEADWAKARYPRNARNRIGIHVSASTRNRNYPEHLLTQLVIELARSGKEVFLIGAEMQWPVRNDKYITNLMLEGLNIRQSIAAMHTCDVLVAPDSVMLHVASATGLKTVGLFGPVHWSNRCTSSCVTALQGCVGCTPCNYSSEPYKGEFPDHCPTKDKEYCALMADIKPERILAKINLLLK